MTTPTEESLAIARKTLACVSATACRNTPLQCRCQVCERVPAVALAIDSAKASEREECLTLITEASEEAFQKLDGAGRRMADKLWDKISTRTEP